MRTYKERTQSILAKAEVQRHKKRTRIKLISIISSVAAAIIAVNLVLFVPYTVDDMDITKYKSSEYYNVIKQIYDMTYSPRKTTNFKVWFGDKFISGNGNGNHLFGAGAEAPSDGAHTASNSYQETTLNQTDGVTEGDLFKRSDAHIYYLGFTYGQYQLWEDCTNGDSEIKVSNETSYDLRVYNIDGENSQEVVEYKITPDKGTTFSGYVGSREMYLSEDLKTITVITPCYEYSTKLKYTVVINVDVSDLSDVKETGRTYVSGSYVSSRIADGDLLLISDFTVWENVNFDKLPTYVPHVGKRGSLKPLFAEDIVCPKNATDPRYTVICSLDSDLEVKDSVALLSYSDDVYVSQNNLFATRTYSKTVKTNNEYDLSYTHNMTEIRIVPYADGLFGDTRSVNAAGRVLNRYSLDEYDGTLRAVTTVSFFESSYSYTDNNPYFNVFKDRCMLYCYDLDTLEVVAKVTDFAPAGESVKSARFDGDTAYVCTAEVRSFFEMNDPVFAFDLSDLNDITYKDTGTIPGYSLSLNNFAFDTLLGIGYGEGRNTLKIELYKQTDSDVTSVAKYEQSSVRFSSEFKAHLIDAEKGIIGLGITDVMFQGGTQYILLRYDGYELTEIASVEMDSSTVDYMRATIIDGYAYIFEDGGYNQTDGLKVMSLA